MISEILPSIFFGLYNVFFGLYGLFLECLSPASSLTAFFCVLRSSTEFNIRVWLIILIVDCSVKCLCSRLWPGTNSSTTQHLLVVYTRYSFIGLTNILSATSQLTLLVVETRDCRMVARCLRTRRTKTKTIHILNTYYVKISAN